MDTTTTTTARPGTTSSGQPPRQSPKPPTEKRHRWVIWLIFILVILGAGYWMYHQHEASQKQAAEAKSAMHSQTVPITTSTVRKGDIGVYVEGLGLVTPVATANITARVQGQITAIHYREGQMVHVGDPLIDIDPRPYEAALTQTQGQLAHDEAILGQAKIDLDRYQAAFSRNAIAQQQVYDQQQAVKQDEGTVQNDQGTVENAKVNLAYTHITSPISGRVGLRLVDLGNMVQANGTSALVVVTQLQPITVIFSVAEDFLSQIAPQLRQGAKLEVLALDRTDEKQIATGTLLTIDNQVDPTTGTFKLRAQFANSDSSLFPNQFVNAKLLVKTLKGVSLVPTAAIQRNAQGAYVYLVKPDDTVALQTVNVGVTDNDTSSVEGVNEGEVVALSGFDKLQDKGKVTIHNRPGNGSGNGPSTGAGGAGSSTSQPSNGGHPTGTHSNSSSPNTGSH